MTREEIEIANEEIQNEFGQTLADMKKTGDWRNTFVRFLACVECGEHQITTPIYQFYNWDARLVMCYDCQDQPRNKWQRGEA